MGCCSLFKTVIESVCRPLVFGMVHLRALPGSATNSMNVDQISEIATFEAKTYFQCGLDGVIVENMADLPYLLPQHASPESLASICRICVDVRRCVGPHRLMGVQILTAQNKEALSVALASGISSNLGLDFVRVEAFVFGHIGDEGYLDACAGPLLRYRRHIGAQHIAILTDIKKKHSSHAITADVSLRETARAAEFFLSDGIIISGTITGQPAEADDLQNVKCSTALPVFVGSGVTVSNMHEYKQASGWIVGSHFKHNGLWSNEVDVQRVQAFMVEFRKLFNLQSS